MSGFAPPKPHNTDPPLAAATRACILAIGLDHLVAAAQYDGYLAAILDDYRRLQAGDLGRRIVPPVVDRPLTHYTLKETITR